MGNQTNFDVVKANALVGGVQELTDAGAISIKQGVCFLNKAGVIAATLADPTAGAAEDGGDDGKILFVVAKTAQINTLTIAGGANGGGAGADVGTFGGAIGDGVGLVAHNGKWWVINNINVTFA